MAREKNINTFSLDTVARGGYLYSTRPILSSKIANDHITRNILSLININGKKVIDVGAGDGTYTLELLKIGKPKLLHAFDPSIEAVKIAKHRSRGFKNIYFSVGDAYKIPSNLKFDVAVVRGVLHHLYRPQKAIKEISRVAKKIIIIEPNGFNPILKIIEKTSKYHVEHEEKSYLPWKIDKWVKLSHGRVVKRKYAGLVPFFCPDTLAKILKKIEPFMEATPFFRELFCGNYYLLYETD